MRRDADALAAKFVDERFFIRFERVDLYADGRSLVVDAKKRFRFLGSQERHELFHEPLRVAVGDAQSCDIPLRQRREI